MCHAFGEPFVVEEVELDRRGRVRSRAGRRVRGVPQRRRLRLGRLGRERARGLRPRGRGGRRGGGSRGGGLEPGDHVVVTLVRSCGTCHTCRRGQPALCATRFALDERSPLRTSGGGEIAQGLRTAAFAEEVLVHHSQAVPMPRDAARSRLPARVRRRHGLRRRRQHRRCRAGDSVAVIGAGGVGLNCIQAAALLGAEPIVAIDLAADRLRHRDGVRRDPHHRPGRRRRAAGRPRPDRGTRRGLRLRRGGATAAVELALQLVRRGGTVVVAGMPPSGTVALEPAGSRTTASASSAASSARPAGGRHPGARGPLSRGPPAARRARSRRAPRCLGSTTRWDPLRAARLCGQ